MAGELAAEWIKIPDGNGNLQKVWIRDSTARRDIAQLQTDVSGKADAATTLAGYGITDAYTKTQVDGMIPSVPSAYTSNPAMDGTASPGSSTAWARGDHVHPHDSTKADASAIPTKTSDLTNDSGFITSAPVTSVNSQTGAVSLTASDVGALPSSTTIPTKTSDLTNDSGFITSASVPTKTSDLTNDSGFITASAVPDPSSTAPAMDGTAAAGSSTDYARADHVHPSDTSKADVSAVPTATSQLTNDSGFVSLNMFGSPTIIPNGSDLNDYTTPGHYSSESGADAGTLINVPVSANFSLFVINRTTALLSQILVTANRYLYIRHQSTTDWSSWYRFTGTAV